MRASSSALFRFPTIVGTGAIGTGGLEAVGEVVGVGGALCSQNALSGLHSLCFRWEAHMSAAPREKPGATCLAQPGRLFALSRRRGGGRRVAASGLGCIGLGIPILVLLCAAPTQQLLPPTISARLQLLTSSHTLRTYLRGNIDLTAAWPAGRCVPSTQALSRSPSRGARAPTGHRPASPSRALVPHTRRARPRPSRPPAPLLSAARRPPRPAPPSAGRGRSSSTGSRC